MGAAAVPDGRPPKLGAGSDPGLADVVSGLAETLTGLVQIAELLAAFRLSARGNCPASPAEIRPRRANVNQAARRHRKLTPGG